MYRSMPETHAPIAPLTPIPEAADAQAEAPIGIEFRIPPTVGSYDVRHKNEVIGDGRPILTAEKITELTGLEIGELAAVIELPNSSSAAWHPDDHPPKEIIYCFRQRSAQGKHHLPMYMLASSWQLGQMVSANQIGHPPMEEAQSQVIHVQAESRLRLLGLGKGLAPSRHGIGRAHWLPRTGKEVGLLEVDPQLAREYSPISHNHAEVFVDAHGKLHLEDKSKNGTKVRDHTPRRRV
jgi:hypothetical protein